MMSGTADQAEGATKDRHSFATPCGQVEPPFAGREILNVGKPEPDPVRRARQKALRQQVRRDRQIMTTFGCTESEPAPSRRADTMSAHWPLDPTTATSMAFRPPGGMHPRRSVSTLMPLLEPTHVAE